MTVDKVIAKIIWPRFFWTTLYISTVNQIFTLSVAYFLN